MGLDQFFYFPEEEFLPLEESMDEAREETEASFTLRKQNAIHGWIVDHCKEITPNVYYYMTKGDLLELIHTAVDVIKRRDQEYSKEHLPTMQGFFFGSYEYDQFYYSGLAWFVRDAMEALVTEGYLDDEVSNRKGIIYYAWW